MTFLKREMERPNVLVTDMLERLKQKFKQEIPKLACDQIPTTFSSLAEALSLHDPVERASVGNFIKCFLEREIVARFNFSNHFRYESVEQ